MKKNKRIINLLCALIIGVLGISVLLPLVSIIYSISTSEFVCNTDEVSTTENATEKNRSHIPMGVTFKATSQHMIAFKDSVTFDNGQSLPVLLQQGIIVVPEQNYTKAATISEMISSIADVILCLLMVVVLIRLIVNINRGEIFVRRNVRFLSRFGIYMLLMSLIQCINIWVQDLAFKSTGISIDGYIIGVNTEISWSNFLIGLIALLMAQVWSAGINLREENELTI